MGGNRGRGAIETITKKREEYGKRICIQIWFPVAYRDSRSEVILVAPQDRACEK